MAQIIKRKKQYMRICIHSMHTRKYIITMYLIRYLLINKSTVLYFMFSVTSINLICLNVNNNYF